MQFLQVLAAAIQNHLHNYIDNVTDTFQGRALLVLKKTAESGNVNVHIESPILNVEKIYTF